MNEERIKQYDLMYINMAIEASKMSQAIRNKVGCIIVKDHNIIAYGYNGMPAGMSNDCEEIDDQGNIVTKKEVIHSETNAICKAAAQGLSTKDASLYITLMPCLQCSLLIIQSKIKKVFYREEYRDLSGMQLLQNVGILVEKI
ncbi:MAG: deaminase [Candidatus Nanoarchaeia archaeon]|jgi:dCMP deaminase|nr:deaminase [Candidatus Nanoarchaeia archaeon]